MNTRLYTDFIKRLLDIILSIVGLIIVIPFGLIISILIKTDSKGTIFFKHERIGKDFEKIKIYKFRTMVMNAEKEIHNLSEDNKKEYYEKFKLENDPRSTKVGRILRTTSLDELPQFLNVLKGEMSIIGPRPIVENELNRKYTPDEQKILLSVKPGMTGKWCAYSNKNTTYDQRKKMELEYAENITFFEDFKIFLKTIITIIKRI